MAGIKVVPYKGVSFKKTGAFVKKGSFKKSGSFVRSSSPAKRGAFTKVGSYAKLLKKDTYGIGSLKKGNLNAIEVREIKKSN